MRRHGKLLILNLEDVNAVIYGRFSAILISAVWIITSAVRFPPFHLSLIGVALLVSAPTLRFSFSW